MAIINSYPTVTPKGNDLIIGTDVSVEGNPTKTFTIDSINALATGTPASGTVDTIPIFTSAVAVGDSTITKSGSNYTIDGSLIMTGDITVPDTKVLRVGSQANGDLRIYHDGNNSYIDDQGTGDLYIKGSAKVFISTSGGGQLAQFTEGGSAFLYYAGSVRLITTPGGVTVDGDVIVNGGDITLGGTGRIQGIDTVSASTDAASKAYVDSQVGYSTYVARVTQSGTNAPVATVISNNTGLTFTWARNSTGSYTVSPSSSFVVNKTWIQMTGGDLSSGTTSVSIKDISTTTATAVNVNLVNGNVADEITAAFVEIRIYP